MPLQRVIDCQSVTGRQSRMGHYVCPNCGGKLSYQGNVVIPGLFAVLPPRIAQIPKCLDCREALGPANYVPGEFERKNAEDSAKREAEERRRVISVFLWVNFFTLGFALIVWLFVRR